MIQIGDKTEMDCIVLLQRPHHTLNNMKKSFEDEKNLKLSKSYACIYLIVYETLTLVLLYG